MERCDFCKYRFSYECEESMVPSNVFCDMFTLDWLTLKPAEKKYFQCEVMAIASCNGLEGELDG